MDVYEELSAQVFGRSEGQPERLPNPWFSPEVVTDTNKLYDLLPSVHQFFFDKFGLNGANGLGGTGTGASAGKTMGYVTTDFLPSWSNTCPNAGHNRGRISFCKGTLGDDTVTHEYTHAIVYHNFIATGQIMGMTYSGESGALNESLADNMGQFFEYSTSGQSDWIESGKTIGGGVRNLAEPANIVGFSNRSIPQPDRYHSELFYCAEGDQGGVHYNSTVPSKAFYLISEGGFFNGCTVAPLGVEFAANVFMRAMQNYYSATETFNGAYLKLVQACTDIATTIGDNRQADNCVQVVKALQSVEMDQGGKCSQLQPTVPLCVDADAF